MRHPLTGLTPTLVLALAVGCTPTVAPTPRLPELRVGMTPNSPPLVFRRAGQPVGLEVDLATALATELGRHLRIVPLPWDEEIPALEAGRIDVVMSGMSVTRARQARVAFANPYLRSGLAAMTRRADVERYPSLRDITNANVPIGVVTGTTGASYVRENMNVNQVSPYPSASAAVEELRGRRIDVFIHDIPTVVWFVSTDEAELRVIRKRVNEEQLAWAFRLDDPELRTAANRALARWEQDGTLDRMISTWLPYWSQIE